MNMPRGALVTILAIGLMAFAATLSGEVRRVPQDYGSIQAALNAVVDDDTVLVSLGTYAEELVAPPLRFWLIGNVEVDTGDFERPVVDPSSLDSALWRRCMTIPDSSEPTIERMAFVNGASMYPVRPYSTGGIYVHSAQPAVFRYCAFDSVRWAITSIADSVTPPRRVHFTIEDCRFTNAPRAQVEANGSGHLYLRRSFFHGLRGAFLSANDSAWVEDCVFTGDSIGGGIVIVGSHPVIRNCVFGPIDTCRFSVLRIAGSNVMVEGNLFHDIRLISPEYFCGLTADSSPIWLRHNQFVNIRASFSSLAFAPSTMHPPAIVAEIDSNLFLNMVEDCTWAAEKALGFGHHTLVRGNRFIDLFPASIACINAYHPPGSPPSEFRHNIFQAGDYAISDLYRTEDAIWNYWGDPSGPYNALFNPNGLGARVDDSVWFDPWCADINCLLSVPGLGQPLPKEFVFEAYPNPFNGTVTLDLIPPEVMIVRVELFDVLGRKVKDIWSGPLAFQKQITFDGSQLSSGIYFARVWQPIGNRPMALKKLMLLK
jgi:hypothetical protein